MILLALLSLNPGLGFRRVETLLNCTDSAHSWFRVGDPLVWSICTNESATTWNHRLGALTKPHGTALILESPSESPGYMTTTFWDWLRLHRQCYQPVEAAPILAPPTAPPLPEPTPKSTWDRLRKPEV